MQCTHTAYVALVVVVGVFIDVFKQTPSRRGGAEGDAGDTGGAGEKGGRRHYIFEVNGGREEMDDVGVG